MTSSSASKPKKKSNVRFTGKYFANSAQRVVQHTRYQTNGGRLTETVVLAGPPAKRARTEDDAIGNTPLYDMQDDSEQYVPPPRDQRASTIMQDFLTRMDDLGDILLEQEGFAPRPAKCECGKDGESAIYQCRECFQLPAQCAECVRAAHRHMPYHWIHKWTGAFWEKMELSDLGVVVTLSHRGASCPELTSNVQPHPVVVVHTNGVHKMNFHFCRCYKHADNFMQLAREGYFAATTTAPATVFTCKLLKDFHLFMLQSKVPAYEYFETLKRMTDNVLPDSTLNRYREFVRVACVWRHLTTRKRSGQYLGLDTIVPASVRPQGSYAVTCPACPADGFNLPDEWRAKAEEHPHLFAWHISLDGCHSLQRKIKVDDPDDVSLNEGHGYFVEDAGYYKYLTQFPNSGAEEKSTCTRLKAINLQSRRKFKNAIITGVVAAVCTDHGYFLPQGMVDLQLGERYSNVDYALAQVLKGREALQSIKVWYDVSCQYFIHVLERFIEQFPDATLHHLIKTVEWLIPKMHLATAHKEDCKYRFASNYTQHCGRTSGEMIETMWAPAKKSGANTKEMNHGHRHETLDAFHGDWNWRKTQHMSNSLLRQYTNARAHFTRTANFFEGLSETMPEKHVAEWQKLSTEPYLKNGEWCSVYKPEVAPRMTQAKAFQALSEVADNGPRIRNGHGGTPAWVNKALHIQATQRKCRYVVQQAGDRPLVSEEHEIEGLRERLENEIRLWRKYQYEHFPDLHALIVKTGEQQPEDQMLFLPSDFESAAICKRYGVDSLTESERTLREGEAYDALHSLKEAIKHLLYATQTKKSTIRGQKDCTRANDVIKKMTRDRNQAAAKYRNARAALIKLGHPDDDPNLQELLDGDVSGKSIHDPLVLGDGKKAASWIWMQGPRNGEDRDTWSIEVDRVQWFRARADRDRWCEAYERTGQEFKNTIRSFEAWRNAWTQAAECCDSSSVGQGRRAYAMKTAAMYDRLRRDCIEKDAQARAKDQSPRTEASGAVLDLAD